MAQPITLSQGSTGYPQRLLDRLGAEAPASLTILGDIEVLQAPMAALFCSKETPGATILKAFDQAAAWRDAGRCIVSGFHSPLEHQCLDILLRGKQPIIMAIARGLNAVRLPSTARQALNAGRLTIVSPFPVSERRATADLARQRNYFAAALADEAVFAYIAPDGSLSTLAKAITRWGINTSQLQT